MAYKDPTIEQIKALQAAFKMVRTSLGDNDRADKIFNIIKNQMNTPEKLEAFNDWSEENIDHDIMRKALVSYADTLQELGGGDLDELEESYLSLGRAVFENEDIAGYSATNWSFVRSQKEPNPEQNQTPGDSGKTPPKTTPDKAKDPSNANKSGNKQEPQPKPGNKRSQEGSPNDTTVTKSQENLADVEGNASDLTTPSKDMSFDGRMFNHVDLSRYQQDVQAADISGIGHSVKGQNFGVMEFVVEELYDVEQVDDGKKLEPQKIKNLDAMHLYGAGYLGKQLDRLGLTDALTIRLPTKNQTESHFFNKQSPEGDTDQTQNFEAVQVIPKEGVHSIKAFSAMKIFLKNIDHDDPKVVEKIENRIAHLEERLEIMKKIDFGMQKN